MQEVTLMGFDLDSDLELGRSGKCFCTVWCRLHALDQVLPSAVKLLIDVDWKPLLV